MLPIVIPSPAPEPVETATSATSPLATAYTSPVIAMLSLTTLQVVSAPSLETVSPSTASTATVDLREERMVTPALRIETAALTWVV
jgi:hypothetical protein